MKTKKDEKVLILIYRISFHYTHHVIVQNKQKKSLHSCRAIFLISHANGEKVEKIDFAERPAQRKKAIERLRFSLIGIR